MAKLLEKLPRVLKACAANCGMYASARSPAALALCDAGVSSIGVLFVINDTYPD